MLAALLKAGTVACVAMVWAAPAHGASAHDPLGLNRALAHPSGHDRPGMLWWWPGAAVTGRETTAEIAAMRSAGFGSAQIVDLEGYSDLRGPRAWQWGTPDWFDRFAGALRSAQTRKLRVDTAPYPIWMMTSPAVSGANLDLSAQQLSYGTQQVTGPTDLSAPPPPATAVAGDKKLVAVTAAQPAGGDTTLDPASAVDLTGDVRSDGRVHWSVPPGRWLLFGFWSRPTGQLPNSLFGLAQDANLDAVVPDTTPGRLLTVDPFNPAATQAALTWLDQNIGPQTQSLLRANGGELYEDSMEYFTGTNSTPWTPRLLDEFRARRGYALTRFLPTLVVPDLYTFWKSGATVHSAPAFDFAGGLGGRIRHDYYETLTDLYIAHQQQLQGWAQDHGLIGFRHQDYGFTIDSSRAQLATGTPDTESLAFGEPWPAGSPQEQQALDADRVAAGAAHIGGAPEVNLETGDVQGCDKGFCPYGEQPTDYWRIINRAYTAGVTHIQIHGMAYRHLPPSEAGIQSNPWPGWNPWAGIFSEPWTQTWPQWPFWAPFTTYLGRASQLLSQGRPAVDLLFYRDNFLGAAAGDLGNTRRLALDEAGYSYDFIDPGTLAAQGTVGGGRLFPDGPAYKALVIDGADNWVAGMPGTTAQRIADLARQGLPIVFVGDPPSQGTSGRDPAGEDATVRQAIGATLGLPDVRHVDSADQVGAALQDLSVVPDAAWDRPVLVRSVHRRTATGHTWYLFNDGDKPVRFDATLAATGTPYAVDLWDDTTTPIAYRHTASGLRVPLRLGPQQALALGVARAKATGPRAGAPAAVAGGRSLRRWILRVQPFSPRRAAPRVLRLRGLRDWQAIPALKNVAGTGTYTTRFTVPVSWLRRGTGVALTVGRVDGASRLSLNGRLVTNATIALPGDRHDVGRLLRAGANTLTVTVATPPLNALRRLGLAGVSGYIGFAGQPAAHAGLLGPVRLSPFRRP